MKSRNLHRSNGWAIAQSHRLYESLYDLAKQRVTPSLSTVERSLRRSRKSVRAPLRTSHHRRLSRILRPLLGLSVRKRTNCRLHQTPFNLRPRSVMNETCRAARRAIFTASPLHPDKIVSWRLLPTSAPCTMHASRPAGCTPDSAISHWFDQERWRTALESGAGLSSTPRSTNLRKYWNSSNMPR